MLKKYLLFSAFLGSALLVQSCRKEDSTPGNTQDPASINAGSLSKVALDYVTDRAVLIEWYVDHPEALQAALIQNKRIADGDTGENELVRYYNEQTIYNISGSPQNFFDLPDARRHQLMKDMIKMDAQLLTEKYAMFGNAVSDDQEENENAITDNYFQVTYTDELDFDAARAKITEPDPHAKIIQDQNAKLLANLQPLSSLPDDTTTDAAIVATGSFFNWVKQGAEYIYNNPKSAILNGINSIPVVIVGNILFSKTKISPTDFVNKLRDELQPGRVLVAVPASLIAGGDIAFGNGTFDVGHVAIVSKRGSEIPAQVPDNYSITIGTNSEKNMHHEEIFNSWTAHHGSATLMQACYNEYREVPGEKFRVERKDYSNGPVYNKIASVIGTKYTPVAEMLIANEKAPGSFICSSSAWWAIKAAHGDSADITPGLNATFPKDVLKSPKMRVVAKTF